MLSRLPSTSLPFSPLLQRGDVGAKKDENNGINSLSKRDDVRLVSNHVRSGNIVFFISGCIEAISLRDSKSRWTMKKRD